MADHGVTDNPGPDHNYAGTSGQITHFTTSRSQGENVTLIWNAVICLPSINSSPNSGSGLCLEKPWSMRLAQPSTALGTDLKRISLPPLGPAWKEWFSTASAR
jgi:hypothetical protein